MAAPYRIALNSPGLGDKVRFIEDEYRGVLGVGAEN
jgi:hypothetical protein